MLATWEIPTVSDELKAEYQSYVSQFEMRNLHLEPSLSDKDSATYHATARLAAGVSSILKDDDEFVQVAEVNRAVYREAVRVGGPGAELRAALERGLVPGALDARW